MSSHLDNIRLLPLAQRAELKAEAKTRAHALREEALDDAWSVLYRQLAQSLGAVRTMLWPQSRTPRKEASHGAGIVTRRVQNRPRGPLRLMDP